jgi:TonB family protein
MKFKSAVTLSILAHVSLFALAILSPEKRNGSGTIYYVDLIQMGGQGNGRGSGGSAGGGKKTEGGNREEKGASLMETRAGSVRNLAVSKETPAALRYPDKEGRRKPEEKKLISVIRKEKPGSIPQTATGRTGTGGTDGLKMGISAGNGSGGDGTSGDGTGGDGGGGGIGTYFPYAYYVDTVRNKISSSWYSSLVEPGLKGRFVSAVYFKILRSGQITDVRVEKASGISSLDLSAMRAVENAAPFAALPGDFQYPHLIVHFEFEWEKK